MHQVKILYEEDVYGCDLSEYNNLVYKFLNKQGTKYSAQLRKVCTICLNVIVDDNYTKIINQLKKANLLVASYPYICCECYKNTDIIIKD